MSRNRKKSGMSVRHEFEYEYELRDQKERRRVKTFPPLKHLIFGRRKTVRRASDSKGQFYTDDCRPLLATLIIFIIIMSIIDYGFTLIHLDRDAVELNPLLAMAIEVSDGYFFLLKYLITSLGLIILYLYKDFFPTHKVALFIYVIYSGVILYHIAGLVLYI